MKEKFILKQSEILFEDGEPKIRYCGFFEGTDENYCFDVFFELWNQIYYEYDGNEELTDDACVQYAMNLRGHNNIQIERSL